MRPNIFVSSTIADLHYLRDNVMSLMFEMGYNPILSEYGGIGYGPGTSAIQACYKAVSQCQLAIVIIGRRYGAQESDGLSITHHEFRTAREKGIPTFHLVETEVLTSKSVFDANQNGRAPSRSKGTRKAQTPITFPGMDAPEKTFAFIQEIGEYDRNNGILRFSTADDARKALKEQLAHTFHELLTERYDPVKENIKDVLAEVKTLRHEISRSPEVL